ncbi:MAG: hypothetical protein M1828_002710, partial [Chrysothrix sp. TS-e1954]
MQSILNISIWALLTIIPVSAFPNLQPSSTFAPAAANVRRQNPSAIPPFDAKSQLVSTSGLHAWRAPGVLD